MWIYLQINKAACSWKKNVKRVLLVIRQTKAMEVKKSSFGDRKKIKERLIQSIESEMEHNKVKEEEKSRKLKQWIDSGYGMIVDEDNWTGHGGVSRNSISLLPEEDKAFLRENKLVLYDQLVSYYDLLVACIPHTNYSWTGTLLEITKG
jgi:hypothetical protein